MTDQLLRRIVLLTQGNTEPITGKTAVSVLRYRPDEVVALLDSEEAGKTAGAVLHVGGETPIVATLDEAPSADTLMIGIAPSGGKIPPAWKPIILQAIGRGMNVVSGLHDFLVNDPDFVAAAKQQGVELVDVRKNNERDVSNLRDLRDDCVRIHTVGQDCCVGKMVVSLEIARTLNERGRDAKFIATGQTGILVEGDGCPIDCVVADFISGSTEKMILANQHHEFLVVEGQGSLAHPRYSGVTLGLLHGCVPHGMIMCYEAGRTAVHGMDHVPLQPLAHLVKVYEQMANLMGPSRVIGVGMNSRRLGPDEAEAEREKVSSELGLPVCDVFRHGADVLADAVLQLAPTLVG
ncbi:MAG: DUF1611 domain-containing protein [Planctomycetales bacterium]|nr:DUF1611 domain-containing protein [Planctomycetales bacterium]